MQNWKVILVTKWVIGKYIRLSQADRDLMKKDNKSESESISNQKALIQNFINSNAELRGCEQFEFFDDGYSGTNFERPSFERLLEKIKKGDINCVIVKDFSRFGRSYIELGDYLERIFPFLGVRFISINDHYDSQDYKGTTGGLDVVMKNIVYDYYSKDLSVKIKTAKYQKMKQGKYIGGHVPYGLAKDPDDKHKLVADPEAAGVVREIFDMALDGMKIVDIARVLNERGTETPAEYYRARHPGSSKFGHNSSKSCWSHCSVRKILQQEMYYGAIVGHKRQGLSVGGKHTTKVDKSEQYIVEGMHDGIVSKEEFLEVQKRFRKQSKTDRILPKDYPLYRKVKCGTCGRAMNFRVHIFRGNEYRYFVCPHAKEQIAEDGCSRRYVTEELLNKVIWETIRTFLDMTDAVKVKLDEKSADIHQHNLSLADTLASLQRKKEKCEADRFTNVDMFMSGNLDKDTYQRKRTELAELSERIDSEIEETKDMLRDAETAADDEMAAVYKKMKAYSGEQQLTQKMVQALIDKVLVTDSEHVEIVWKFSDEIYKFIME